MRMRIGYISSPLQTSLTAPGSSASSVSAPGSAAERLLHPHDELRRSLRDSAVSSNRPLAPVNTTAGSVLLLAACVVCLLLGSVQGRFVYPIH